MLTEVIYLPDLNEIASELTLLSWKAPLSSDGRDAEHKRELRPPVFTTGKKSNTSVALPAFPREC